MVRKPKFSKEVKIKVCQDYENGHAGFTTIAKEIGAHEVTVFRWYLRYKEHGPIAFETSKRNRSYSKDFKLSVVEEYISGKYSFSDLSAKHNISNEVIRNWVDKWYRNTRL